MIAVVVVVAVHVPLQKSLTDQGSNESETDRGLSGRHSNDHHTYSHMRLQWSLGTNRHYWVAIEFRAGKEDSAGRADMPLRILPQKTLPHQLVALMLENVKPRRGSQSSMCVDAVSAGLQSSLQYTRDSARGACP